MEVVFAPIEVFFLLGVFLRPWKYVYFHGSSDQGGWCRVGSVPLLVLQQAFLPTVVRSPVPPTLKRAQAAAACSPATATCPGAVVCPYFQHSWVRLYLHPRQQASVKLGRKSFIAYRITGHHSK